MENVTGRLGLDTPPGTLGTIRNAAVLLHLLSEGPAYQPLTDLAERAGLTAPTVHRLLRSLKQFNLVEQDPRSSRYGLGPELVRLSACYLDRLPALSALNPYLVQLRNVTKATVQVAALVGTSVVYVDRVDGEDGSGLFRDRRRADIAVRTAAGRVLFARAAPSMRGEAERMLGLSISEEEWQQWETSPYLCTRADDHTSITEIAVPVEDSAGYTLVCLSASAASDFIAQEGEDTIAQHLLRAASSLRGVLGHG